MRTDSCSYWQQAMSNITIRHRARCFIIFIHPVFTARVIRGLGRQWPWLSDVSSRCCWCQCLFIVHCSKCPATTTACASHCYTTPPPLWPLMPLMSLIWQHTQTQIIYQILNSEWTHMQQVTNRITQKVIITMTILASIHWNRGHRAITPLSEIKTSGVTECKIMFNSHLWMQFSCIIWKYSAVTDLHDRWKDAYKILRNPHDSGVPSSSWGQGATIIISRVIFPSLFLPSSHLTAISSAKWSPCKPHHEACFLGTRLLCVTLSGPSHIRTCQRTPGTACVDVHHRDYGQRKWTINNAHNSRICPHHTYGNLTNSIIYRTITYAPSVIN